MTVTKRIKKRLTIAVLISSLILLQGITRSIYGSDNNALLGGSSLSEDAEGSLPADENKNSESSFFDLVTVGDPFNAPDNQGIGSVSKSYEIGKYEVTARQYAIFLNAVAWKEDPHGLYHPEMGTDKKIACIKKVTQADGTYQYQLLDEQRGSLPITYVSLNDAKRFCNWLENGAPSHDILQQSTESGTYTFSQNGSQPEVNEKAHFYIPTDDEWMKAAYYKGNGINAGYWMYPTQHDTAPASGLGDVSNFANYQTYRGSLENNFLDDALMIATVDRFDQTKTAYQAHDMGGNVAEWTISPGPSETALARGGSWQSVYSWYGNNDLMRTAVPKSYDPSTATNFIGFRIAMRVDEDSLSAQTGNEDLSQAKDQPVQLNQPSADTVTKASSSNKPFLGKVLVTGAVLGGSAVLFIGAEILIGTLFPEVAAAEGAAALIREGELTAQAISETNPELAETLTATINKAAVIINGMPVENPELSYYANFLKSLESFPLRRVGLIITHLVINAYAIAKAQ